LEGEFSGRDEDEGLDVGEADVDVVESRNEEGGGLSDQFQVISTSSIGSLYPFRSWIEREYLFQSVREV
jgi:hypothetical protein